ncbi:MAG: SOUL family heme-binding protein [Candidatus Poseidoniales archaeon]|jgi:hypothetical protein|tara:strand:+ start:337 stop:864 length:528 start_codon:yes stop_codon:yes gene_type:complete
MAEDLEEPKYDLVSNFGSFETRLYHDTIQARVNASSEAQDSISNGFRTIAGYIFGSNDSGEKIAMTAPVHMWSEQGIMKMAFTMPSEHGLSDLPVPNNSSIEIVEVTGRLTAVMKFSGFAGRAKVRKLSVNLLKSISQNKLEPISSHILAIYDNPWTTLPFLRRNEILVPIKDNS